MTKILIDLATAQQALEALEEHGSAYLYHGTEYQKAITALRKALAQPVQEPVVWDKPSEAFNAWWDGEYDDSTNPFTKHSFAYWAFAGWQAAQRPWQGLTEQDMPSGEDPMFDHQYFCAGMVYAAKVLQEKNNG
jgi:hypothetical protein